MKRKGAKEEVILFYFSINMIREKKRELYLQFSVRAYCCQLTS